MLVCSLACWFLVACLFPVLLVTDGCWGLFFPWVVVLFVVGCLIGWIVVVGYWLLACYLACWLLVACCSLAYWLLVAGCLLVPWCVGCWLLVACVCSLVCWLLFYLLVACSLA